MAYHFRSTCFFVLTFLQNDLVMSAMLTLGQDFAFAVPTMSSETESKITVFIHTSVKQEIKVTIVTEGFYKGDGLNEEVTVISGQSIPYTLPSKYYYSGGTGVKWSYRLRCTDLFGVTVLVLDSQTSVATFLAVPLGSWGKLYYAVTLGHNPFIQIIAGRYPALVRVRLLISAGLQTPNLNITYQDEVLVNLKEISVPLQRFQVFELSDCRKDNSHGSLSGTRITAQRPVGVISGSCSSNSLTSCLGTNKATDITVEMLLPRETFGKEFVTPSLSRQYEPGTYTFIPVKNSTVVHYLNARGSLQQIRLALEEEPKTQTMSKVYAWMKSIEPVQIFYTNQSACTPQTTESLGVITLALLLPLHLYYYNYVIIFFNIYKDLDAGSIPVSEGFHEILNANKLAFGCHLLGYGPGFAYSHPAGLMAIHINQDCEQKLENMFPGDMIDNDCDGQVDEEFKDDTGSDNSKAYFLEWEDWHCTDNCSDLRLMRSRKCVHPNPKKTPECDGVSVQYKMGICYYNSTSCPDDCPDFRWGTGCRLSCSNCETPCNKFFGTCPRCKPGFKDTQNGCRYPCDKNRYGINCTGNCEEKCGEDCRERVQGDCPSSQQSVLVIMVVVLLLPCINLMWTEPRFTAGRDSTIQSESTFDASQ